MMLGLTTIIFEYYDHPTYTLLAIGSATPKVQEPESKFSYHTSTLQRDTHVKVFNTSELTILSYLFDNGIYYKHCKP